MVLTRLACLLDFLSAGAADSGASELPTAATSCREEFGFQYSRLTGAIPLPIKSVADKLLRALDMARCELGRLFRCCLLACHKTCSGVIAAAKKQKNKEICNASYVLLLKAF